MIHHTTPDMLSRIPLAKFRAETSDHIQELRAFKNIWLQVVANYNVISNRTCL